MGMACGVLWSACGFVRADVIARWTFDGSNTVAAIGTNVAGYVGGTMLSSWPWGCTNVCWSTKAYPPQGQSNRMAGVLFPASTAGYTNIVVSFWWMPSDTASSNGLFQYSVDSGASWLDWPSHATMYSGSTWSSRNLLTFDLSSVAGAANEAGFCWRFVSVFRAGGSEYDAAKGGETYGSAGTWKFDEVTLSGTPLAEAATPASWLRPGDVAVIGWNRSNDLFVAAALAPIPAETVIYFTDNGWSNAQFRGASASGGKGSEALLKLRVLQPLAAGTLFRCGETNAAFVWATGETIPGGGDAKFSVLAVNDSGGDQVYAFQAPAENPLWSPAMPLFVLDDTGAFEDAIDPNTGAIAPGLVAGRTALTFPHAGSSQYFLAFTNLDGQARTKIEWLSFLANSNHWAFGSTGELPSGALAVALPPQLTVLASPAEGGSVFGSGRHDEGEAVTLMAVAQRGWVFTRWSDGDTHAVRTLIMPAGDTILTAGFAWRGMLVLFR